MNYQVEQYCKKLIENGKVIIGFSCFSMIESLDSYLIQPSEDGKFALLDYLTDNDDELRKEAAKIDMMQHVAAEFTEWMCQNDGSLTDSDHLEIDWSEEDVFDFIKDKEFTL